jgi:hypothetical protein
MKALFDTLLPKLEQIIDLCVYQLNHFIVFTDKYCKQIKKIISHYIHSRVSLDLSQIEVSGSQIPTTSS